MKQQRRNSLRKQLKRLAQSSLFPFIGTTSLLRSTSPSRICPTLLRNQILFSSKSQNTAKHTMSTIFHSIPEQALSFNITQNLFLTKKAGKLVNSQFTRYLFCLRLLNALIFSAAEAKNKCENIRKQKYSDSKASSFTEGFSHSDTENNIINEANNRNEE